MTKQAVYLFLKKNRLKLTDKVNCLAADLINYGAIPLEPVLVGCQDSWRLLSNDDVRSYVDANQQHLNYLAAYEADPSCTQAYLKYDANEAAELYPKELKVFRPFIDAWAKGILAFNIRQLPLADQELCYKQYFKTLADIESLAYNAITLSIGENIGLLRKSRKGIEVHLAHAEKEVADIEFLKTEKIPALNNDLKGLHTKISIYEKELRLLNSKKDLYSDMVGGSEKDLRLLYEREEIFSLITLREDMLNNEQVSLELVTKSIHEINLSLKEAIIQKDRLILDIKLHQARVSGENIGQQLNKKVAFYQAQLIAEQQCRTQFEQRTLVENAREKLSSFFLNYKNKHLSYLKHAPNQLEISEQELDQLINFCCDEFKLNNFYEPKQKDKKIIPFVKWVQVQCRNGYNQAFASSRVKGQPIDRGEFYCREIGQCISSSNLVDATKFLSIIIGAIYVSNEENIEALPEEIINYFNEINDTKKLDKSLDELLQHSVKALNDFIEAPAQHNFTELETNILKSLLIPPKPQAHNVLFFSPPPQMPVRANKEDEANQHAYNS